MGVFGVVGEVRWDEMWEVDFLGWGGFLTGEEGGSFCLARFLSTCLYTQHGMAFFGGEGGRRDVVGGKFIAFVGNKME